MIDTPRSCIYRGRLRHRRFVPRAHAFSYQLWMAWLDLDELPRLFAGVPGFSARRGALARFCREDYLAPHDRPLAQAVRERLASELGGELAAAADGRVCMLAQLRVCGVTFNPLTLYYVYDRHERLRAVLGEVTNTPWGERQVYACAVDPVRHLHGATFAKALHVSPFNPMDMDYRWRFNNPGEHLYLHMENWREGTRHFDATLTLTARPATRRVLVETLFRQPWMSLKTVTAIHFEAFRLWAKRAPIHAHPRRDPDHREDSP
ncbi:DUF1365 domain-containing protein [Modicisalibacter radicis]|uniref:DUF1365 domain-containing protein n=1 Tax=Halomonas sp. EAR18 TaxID=2518972 RepID=UPI00109C757F|nr:DUF1365 domain-containing protein [Halomonas sp. EAR18]